MKPLSEILENINKANDTYRTLELKETAEQSLILRDLSCCFLDLVMWKDEFRNNWIDAYNESTGSNAKKEREADDKVRELEKVRDILKAIEHQMNAIRSTISANKNQG